MVPGIPKQSILLLLLFSGVIVSLRSGLMAQALAMSMNSNHHHLVSHRIRDANNSPFRDHHDSLAIFPKFYRAVASRPFRAIQLPDCVRSTTELNREYFQESGWTLRRCLNATTEKPLGEATLEYLTLYLTIKACCDHPPTFSPNG
jgi:hypothetical protein